MRDQSAVMRSVSPEVWAMLHPGAAFSDRSRLTASGAVWTLLRRPLFLALVLGCTVSLITAQSLTLRLVTSGAVTWSFVPVLEGAALAVVWGFGNRATSLSRTIDLSFTGHGPWFLWLIAFGAFWSSRPQPHLSGRTAWCWLAAAAVVLAWSGYIDFCFHRCALQRGAARAIRDILLQRTLCWIPAILIFGYGSLWPDLVELFR
ncbi:MAG: hypothetical protein LAP40_10640 [Acidobacteriia bacterium]|nr:hypothetical protein [Terriglobia bacterium]